MEGREKSKSQSHHSRGFYEGHHYGHGMYPFTSHWPEYSPGNVTSSAPALTSSVTSSKNSSSQVSKDTHATSSPSPSGHGPSWWHPPSFSGLPTSEMLHYSASPWAGHEHHESHTSSRDSGRDSTSYHGTHGRNGPYHSPDHHSHMHGHSHGHGYHHGRSSHVHGSTLIHFPHSSGHHSLSSNEEKRLSPSHKDKQGRVPKGERDVMSPSEGLDRKHQDGSAKREHSHHKGRSLYDEIPHHHREDSFSPPNRSEKALKMHRAHDIDTDRDGHRELGYKEAKVSRLEMPKESTLKEKERHHSKHPMFSLYDEPERISAHETYLTQSSKPAYITSVSDKALASAKASYLNKDHSDRSSSHHPHDEKCHNSYPFSSYTDKDGTHHIPGIMNPVGPIGERDMHSMKRDHHSEHMHHRASPVQREVNNGSPQSDRMSKAEATREWVNKQPDHYAGSSFDPIIKTDQRCKFGEPLNKKRESPKVMSPRGAGSKEKHSKKEAYESPLNSSIPRYSGGGGGHSVKSEPMCQRAQAKGQKQHQSRNPFNVDFLSVSSDVEGKSKELERHFHVPSGHDKPSDRISVIQSPLTMPSLYTDNSETSTIDRGRSHHAMYGREFYESSNLKRPTSLLDSPLQKKSVVPMTGKPRSFAKPDDFSPKISESSSGSEDESIEDGDEEADTNDTQEKDNEISQDGTENDEEESAEGSEEESGSESEAGESSGSGSGSESEDADTQSQSTQDASDNCSITGSTLEKRKAGAAEGNEPKKRKVVDENLLRVPLEDGWRRQTRIRPTGNGESLRGDVYYFAPCGKKIRTYPEVLKYVEKEGIEHLGLDNFSFSTKTTVGEFSEAKQGSKFEMLSEEEVLRRYNVDKERQIARTERMNKKREKKKQKNETLKRAIEARQRKKVEKEVANAKKRKQRVVAEQKRQKKENERQQREMERIHKAEQLRMEKEMRARSLQQEKIHKQERLRIDREMRQRALHEARRNKKEALQHAKMEEAMRKAREREMKRQQTVILKQQEKERRKQHLMMIRALESQRKAEERERKKEEKRLEKRILKQRKMEQRRLERSIARELKKPVDDMVLNDGKPLPDYSRVKGVNIPGKAYADLLMVAEFVYCFGHVLDIDPETDFPGLADLQAALLNESSNDDALVSASEALLSAALQDPGASAKTKLGVSIENIELNDSNISEVLRLFIISRNEDQPHMLSNLLTERPIQSLSPVQKAEILAFLVNELLCSDKIYNEMDNCLEHMSNLRRDKWNMEGRIRKLKADLKSKKSEMGPTAESQGSENNQTPKAKSNLSQIRKKIAQDDEASNTSMAKDDQDDDDDDDEDDEEEDKDSEEEDDGNDDQEEEDDGNDDQEEDESEDTDDGTDPTTVEEIEKRIAKLEKKHSKYRNKLFTASHTLRGLSVGQDRYKRRYHILPHAGGVYVEGMESSEYNEKEAKGKLREERNRRRTSSGNSISDSNLTPTVEEKHRPTLDALTPDSVHNNIDKTILKSPGIKSPGMKSPLFSPGIKSPGQLNRVNNVFDNEISAQVNSMHERGEILSPKHEMVSPKHGMMSPKHGMFSPKHGMMSPNDRILSPRDRMISPTGSHGHEFNEHKVFNSKWFSLFPKKACDETSLTRSSIISPAASQSKIIIPPNVKLLSHDRNFCESISNRMHIPGHNPMHGYMHGMPGHHHSPHGHPHGYHHGPHGHPGHYPLTPNGTSHPIVHYPSTQMNAEHGAFPGSQEGMTKASMLGLAPPGVDIQTLIQQDPQKAAVLLEIQSLEPAAVPEEKQYGWWRINDPEMVHRLLKSLHTRGIREKMLQKSLTRHTEYACSSCNKNKEAFSMEHSDDEENKEPEPLKSPKKDKHKPFKANIPGKIEDRSFPQVAFSTDKDILVEIEELEEKMFSASLQNKTWRLSQKASSNVCYVKKESKLKTEEKPLELAKGRLLSLECGIERRYLKPPFRLEKHPNQTHVAKSNGDSQASADGQPHSSDKDWRITPSLLNWRETVDSCTSAAQLAMCISMLKDCIAWERSIMKVFCIECRKGDNEELLLLCDQCDRGCHTYCCNPRLAKIPDGDWFCRECIMIASGSDQCYGCQGATGRRLKCQFCPRYYHLFCVEPPLQKTPRSPWACPVCKKARLKNKRPTKRKKKPEDEFESLSSFDVSDPPTKAAKAAKAAKGGKAKKDDGGMNNRKQAMKHMAPCRQMLAEMERHECSWPFLVPVNAKQFPEYYQIIKSPMDFHTMKVKLRDFQYKNRNEFANDARLVFKNCNTFNEDDSEVGQAGKRMLKFFEKRWIEVLERDEKKVDTPSKGDGSEDNETAEETSSESESDDDDDDDDNDDDNENEEENGEE